MSLDMEDSDEGPVDPWERTFHNIIREYVIIFLLFLLLMALAYVIVSRFVRRDAPEYGALRDADEAAVHRTALFICTFSLALSMGAALLLPVSIAANEILLYYPRSYYIQWLNASLIHGLWKHIFLLSNLSLLVLLPFAHLFSESEGFSGHGQGLPARVYETSTVLCLLAALVVGMAYVLSCLLDPSRAAATTRTLWTSHLPLIYSLISSGGVLCLLICTPLGFARLFDVVGRLVVRPHLMDQVEQMYVAAQLEEAALRARLEHPSPTARLTPDAPDGDHLCARLSEVRDELSRLERRRLASPLQRNLGYPLAMLSLLALTAIAAFMVLRNSLELLIGIKALPLSTQQATLGITSLSALGPVGAALEIALIGYMLLASLVGCYSLPLLRRLRPRRGDTAVPALIANCAVALVMSSALPLLIRTLGITNFDLLGHYGQIRWLGDFYVVLFYNVVFTVAAALSLTTRFTAAVRQALISRFISLQLGLRELCVNGAAVGAAAAAVTARAQTGDAAAAISAAAEGATSDSVLRVRHATTSPSL